MFKRFFVICFFVIISYEIKSSGLKTNFKDNINLSKIPTINKIIFNFVISDENNYYLRNNVTLNSKILILAITGEICETKTIKHEKIAFFEGIASINVTKLQMNPLCNKNLIYQIAIQNAQNAKLKNAKLTLYQNLDKKMDIEFKRDFPSILLKNKANPKIYNIDDTNIKLVIYYDENDESDIKNALFLNLSNVRRKITDQCISPFSLFTIDNKYYLSFERGPCNSEYFFQEIYSFDNTDIVNIFSQPISQ